MSSLDVGQIERSFGVRVEPDHSDIEDAETLSNLESLIDDARRIGCVEALRKNGHNVDYLLDEKRASYLDIVNLDASDDVLEIGSSMGQHTRLIARRCKSLAAIEVVPHQAVFSKLWCDQEGLENVSVTAGGMSGALPYEDGSFDVVLCNYVLEWCAGRHDGALEAFHRWFLTNIFRTLRPGGRLYLSTKNRYALKYLLGSRDEHLDARFGSALPRWAQDIVRRRARPGKATGYLHSWDDLQNILKEAGFSSLEPILAFPDARYPFYIGPFTEFSKTALSDGELEKCGPKSRASLRLPARLFRKTTNSIVFVARRGMD